MEIEFEDVINNLLEQNKQLTLNNAVLQATIRKMQEGSGNTTSHEQSEGSDEGLQSR